MPRTTPLPVRNIEEIFPEFRALRRTTVRLHPRRHAVPEPAASKLGGEFLWPADEKWPICDVHRIPYVGVLQLTQTDVPEVGYRPVMDLFQLLWCPRDHGDGMPNWSVFWRNAGQVRQRLDPITRPVLTEEETYQDGGWFLPEPCCLNPERVLEYPYFGELSSNLQQRLVNWNLNNAHDLSDRLKEWRRIPFRPGEWFYRTALSIASGTKVGGNPDWIQYPDNPNCSCGRPMEHMLSISTLEPIGCPRWGPKEDCGEGQTLPSGEELLTIRHVTGLELGDGGNIYLFICRSCPDWPVVAEFQCG